MMQNKDAPQTDEQLAKTFADLLDQLVPEDPEEIEELLQEVGLNRKDIRARISALVEELKATTPLDWRNADRRIEEVKAKREQIGVNLPQNREDLLHMLEQLMSQPKGQKILAGVKFRNKEPEKMTDEELRTLVQDVLFASSNLDEDIEEQG
jgi:uncharacterized protein Smg (DUF494 family)